MRPTNTEKVHYSSQLITFYAYFAIPILDSAAREPISTILSDFGNGTVSHKRFLSPTRRLTPPAKP
jgi:hypothetical protein